MAQPNAAAAADISALPDALLVHCFGFLSQRERLSAVSACRRFRALSTELLWDVDAKLSGPATAVLPKARSLLAWMQAHGGRIRSLELGLPPAVSALPWRQQEAAALVEACLTACSGPASSLQSLGTGESPLSTAAWLPAMRRLQQARMGCSADPLHLPAGLSSLANLSRLMVWGSLIELGGPLPPGLTHLHIWATEAAVLPPQVSLLPHLRHLSIGNSFSLASLAGLPRISTLTRLDIVAYPDEGDGLPANLTALTGLRCLRLLLPSQEGAAAEQVEAVLGALQGLTALAIEEPLSEAALPAVAGLPQLQQLLIEPLEISDDEGEEEPDPLPPLLSGAWQDSIRQLCACPGILFSSLPALRGATQLTHLCIAECGAYPGAFLGEQDCNAFFEWAAKHPSLRRLSLDFNTNALPSRLFDHIQWLHGARPFLEVFRYNSNEHPLDFHRAHFGKPVDADSSDDEE